MPATFLNTKPSGDFERIIALVEDFTTDDLTRKAGPLVRFHLPLWIAEEKPAFGSGSCGTEPKRILVRFYRQLCSHRYR